MKNSEMRSLFVISLVVLVCFMDHSYGTFVEFLSNLPNEISRAFSIAWESMEDAIKQPVKIIRIGSGGKLKTTTVRTKMAIHHEKTEWLPERQINWQPEQVATWSPSRRVEWHFQRKPNRTFERTLELKRKLEWQPDRQLKQKHQQQHEQQHEEQNKQQHELQHEEQIKQQHEQPLERPIEWPRRWQPELNPKPQPEQKPQQILKHKHHELKLERQPQRELDSNHKMKPESHIKRKSEPQLEQQPKRQPEQQLDQALSRQNEQHSRLLYDITDFRKSHSILTIPFLEKPKYRPMSNNIMRLFHGHNHRISRRRSR